MIILSQIHLDCSNVTIYQYENFFLKNGETDKKYTIIFIINVLM